MRNARTAGTSAGTRGGGLRREATILLPISLLLFAALACVTLLTYRTAISRVVEERRSFALRAATLFAERVSALPGGVPELGALRDMLPPDSSCAIFDARGALLASAAAVGVAPDRTPAAGAVPDAAALAGATVAGPGPADGESGGFVVAWAPYATRAAGGATERRLLRFEIPEPSLAAELKTLRILTPAVFVLSAAVAALAIAFLYALNRPIAALLERARALPDVAGADPRARGGDETDFLLAAFDRALAALRASDSDASPDARRDAEARLARSVAELGELSAGVAHELRNSLGTLQGYLALLARRELPAAAREEVDEARRETEALARVVDDFLAFARPELGAVEPLDLVALVERALADPSLAAGSFRRDYRREPIEIRGSDRLLRRALRNLLLNAVQAQQAADETLPIEVAIAARGDVVRVSIRDHGGGIDPALAERLFAPFASGRAGGAGLGLALARRIVLLHHGRLALADAPGGGALAEIELPAGAG